MNHGTPNKKSKSGDEGGLTSVQVSHQSVKPETMKLLEQLDCPTVFNAVHQLTPKPDNQVGQWEDSFVLDPNTIYTDATIKVMCSPKECNQGATVVGFAVPSEVTTNDPDSHEDIDWVQYYTKLQASPGPKIAVMKDVDMLYPGRSAVFGDGMSTLHQACGCVGAICDGVIRDLDGIKKVGFPIWGTGEVSGHGRFVVKAFNVPVTAGGLRICPGDLIMADAGGAVKIPLAIADKVAERAMNIRGKEARIFEYFRSADFKASEMGIKQAEINAQYDKEFPESFWHVRS